MQAALRTQSVHASGHVTLLSWNLNGVHARRRRGTGDPHDDSDDEPLGDGFDLRADATSKLRAAMQTIRDKEHPIYP